MQHVDSVDINATTSVDVKTCTKCFRGWCTIFVHTSNTWRAEDLHAEWKAYSDKLVSVGHEMDTRLILNVYESSDHNVWFTYVSKLKDPGGIFQIKACTVAAWKILQRVFTEAPNLV